MLVTSSSAPNRTRSTPGMSAHSAPPTMPETSTRGMPTIPGSDAAGPSATIEAKMPPR